MRIVRILALVALLVLPIIPSTVRAQTASALCVMTLGPADLPPEMQPDAAGNPDLNLSDDPTICERSYTATRVGETGLSSVRSLVMMSPSEKQASTDWSDYRKLLIQNGWREVGAQPYGEEATAFAGSDARAGIYTVQHLFRRDNMVGILEASGPAMAHSPEILLDLAYRLDQRIASMKSAYGSSIRSGSVWPVVSAPTIVADANLVGAPTVAQNIQLGGLSGLVSLDAFGTEFVAVTDGGPTADLRGPNGSLLIMPLPAFTPSIVKLRLEGNQLKVTERISLRLQDGFTNPRTGNQFVTGLPSTPDEPAAFDQTGRNSWGTDPNGIDPEGIALDPRDGSYWIVEENGPSILHVSADGTILARLIPFGRSLDAPGEGVYPILPSELAYHKALRGFEGVAISPDGGRLFAIMQSPLALPDNRAAEASRSVRLLTLDLTGSEPIVEGMFVYRTEPFNTAAALSQDHVQVSDLTALSAERLVVVEHDNLEGGHFKMAYLVDIRQASNILGWEGTHNGFVESGDLDSVGVVPVEKTPIANLAGLGWQRDAVEGITMVDDSTIAVISDNNFGFGGFDRAGRLLTNGQATRLSIVHLAGPLR